MMTPSGYLVISVEWDGPTCALRLTGDLDICSRDRFRALVSSVLEACPQTLVVDLSAVDFVDCSGLSVLIWAHRRLAERAGQLIVSGDCPAVRRLLRLTGADGYLSSGPALSGRC